MKITITRSDQSKEQGNDHGSSSQTPASSVTVFEAVVAGGAFRVALLGFGECDVELVHAVECALCTARGIGFNSCVPPAFFAALQRVWVVDTFARALN